jgi:hypothetical protein
LIFNEYEKAHNKDVGESCPALRAWHDRAIAASPLPSAPLMGCGLSATIPLAFNYFSLQYSQIMKKNMGKITPQKGRKIMYTNLS